MRYSSLTPRENLMYFARLRQIPRNVIEHRVEDNRKAEWRIVVTEYLITFFKALRSLEPDRPGVSDGIAYDQGSLYVLVGMGDVRVRVPVQEFDPDPAKAAELAINQWKAMTPDEQEMAMEEVRS